MKVCQFFISAYIILAELNNFKWSRRKTPYAASKLTEVLMPILSDCHVHTAFSADSDSPMDTQIRAAIGRGLHTLCFTEHVDLDSPFRNAPLDDPESDFRIDYPAYRESFLQCRERYADQISLLFGLELGLNTSYAEELSNYIHEHPDFDFIIGSTHSARNGMDPYYSSFFDRPVSASAAPTEETESWDPYRLYFEDALQNVHAFCSQKLFDSYGHLDYILRCGPRRADGSCTEQTSEWYYRQYADLIDAILRELIRHDKALELNTSPLKKGFPETNPGKAVLKRYYELGGRLLTIGSDAHIPEAVGFAFDQAAALLSECGFQHYVTYEKRIPVWHTL